MNSEGLQMAENSLTLSTSTRRRVKLYMLNEERQWDDRGTGHVSSGFVESLQGMSLIVRSETDGTLLLESKIQPDTAYQKQQETLIVWSEADNYDLALSFQEKAGCDEIWEKICQVQGKDPSVDITQDVVEESEDERLEDLADTSPPIELPPCELSKLEEISELFTSVLPSPIRREKLSLAIEGQGYIKDLVDLFHMCEDLENKESLHHLYEIFKNMFFLNKTALFEIMFSDDVLLDIVGIFEYDPSQTEPVKHRDYLKNQSTFKEVIPITNKDLLQKIHQTYRVQYIQDVILPTPSVFEENMLSTLSSFVFLNKVEIVTMIQEDEVFLKTLFEQLTDDETDDSKRKDLVMFLKEFCTFSQTLQPANKCSFFKTLSDLGILSALEVILGLDDDELKTAAIDIFSYIVEYNPSIVREFIIQEGQKQEDDDLLINLVIEQMVSDTDPELGGAVQLMGIIRLLIDPENMLATANKTEKTEFLGFFYKRCMHVMTAQLFANTIDDTPSNDDYQTAQLLSLILELLSFCIEHHTYHVKNYVLNKDLLRRVLVLLKSKHTFLVLGALRLMRKVIGLKDEFYNRHIIKGDLLKPVIDSFVANGDRYNLLNSAMIELFEFIKMEDVKSLRAYVVEKHYHHFEKITYVQTFINLKMRNDQQQDRTRERPSLEGVPSILRTNRFRRDARSMEEEEEMYFEAEEDLDDDDTMLPMSEMLKPKFADNEFDQIKNKMLESRKAKDLDNDGEDSLTRLTGREEATSRMKPEDDSAARFPAATRNPSPITININSSPPAMNKAPPPSPANSPVTAGPLRRIAMATPTPYSSPETAEKRPILGNLKVGLVDYPDEDSEEEEDEDTLQAVKRPRLDDP